MRRLEKKRYHLQQREGDVSLDGACTFQRRRKKHHEKSTTSAMIVRWENKGINVTAITNTENVRDTLRGKK